MRTMFIVFHLLSMALSTQSHDFGKLYTTAIGQFQRVIVVRIMAREATDGAVGKCERSMELVQILFRLILKIGLPCRVTG